jgi:hypothetical protein
MPLNNNFTKGKKILIMTAGSHIIYLYEYQDKLAALGKIDPGIKTSFYIFTCESSHSEPTASVFFGKSKRIPLRVNAIVIALT